MVGVRCREIAGIFVFAALCIYYNIILGKKCSTNEKKPSKNLYGIVKSTIFATANKKQLTL